MKVRSWMMAASLLTGLLGAVAARPAAAQSRPDSAAVLLDAARQLSAEGRTAAAAALLELIERRFVDTAAGAEAARLLAGHARAPESERSGRTELLVFGTTYGAWLGAALPLMADAESPEAYGAGLLLGAPAGFLASKLYLDRQPLTEGQAGRSRSEAPGALGRASAGSRSWAVKSTATNSAAATVMIRARPRSRAEPWPGGSPGSQPAHCWPASRSAPVSPPR